MQLGGSRVRTTILAGLVAAAGVAAAARHPIGRQVPSPSAPAPAPAPASTEEAPTEPLATTLAGTGLYADFGTRTISAENRPFSPQYPLWTDGAKKRRWIRLPKGAVIDAAETDAWQFPVGTKLWKEFSLGRPVETRYIERTRDGWRFASYVWSEDGTTATLASDRGQIAPGTEHRVPGTADCRVCHANGKTPVLGFSALQLSVDRDPNALHGEPLPAGAVDLDALTRGGWLRGSTGTTAPRIAARTPTERAALGYLHANCGMCHRSDGPLASLGMALTADAAIATTVGRASRYAPDRQRIASGQPDRSLLVDRMRSRVPALQMPPLGSRLVDDAAVRLMTTWIEELPN